MNNALNVIGIDLGGTHMRASLVNSAGEILASEKDKTPKTPDALLARLQDMTEAVSKEKPAAIGLATAGLVDGKSGVILVSPNMEAAVGQPICATLAERFSVPVAICNDASAAALGEKWMGAGREFDNFILLTLGTGIGGGVVHNGRVLDIAAELGHMTIDLNGRRCSCGMYGCLEAYASASAIVQRATHEMSEGRESMIKERCDGNFYKVTASVIYDLALEGDILSREVLKDAGSYLGIGIASLVNIFSPQAVIIGGGVRGAWNFIYPEIKARVSKISFAPLVADLKILPSELSDTAGVLGAARIALDLLSERRAGEFA